MKHILTDTIKQNMVFNLCIHIYTQIEHFFVSFVRKVKAKNYYAINEISDILKILINVNKIL